MKINSEPQSFCWRPIWLNRFESVWCILRKFSFYNKTSVMQLKSLFSPDEGRAVEWIRYKRLDLREYGGLDPVRLAQVFKVHRNVLEESTIRPFLGEDERVPLSSGKLRFCHSCLHGGFHSSIHQITLITQCPLHAEPLTVRCRYCQATVDYTLSTARFSSNLGCRKCVGEPPVNRQIRGRYMTVPPEREGKFQMTAEFLRRRIELQRAQYPVASWISAKRTPKARQHQVSRLTQYWLDVVSGNANGSASAQSYSCFEYSGSRSFRRPMALADKPNRRDKVGSKCDGELFSILKSIRRQLEKLWLGPHRSCVSSLVRLERSASGICRGLRCPYANVLLLWRLYWENVAELHRLGYGFRNRTRTGREPPINWRPRDPNLPPEVIHRIFAIEALGVLEECFLLVKSLRRNQQYTFSLLFLKDVAGRRMPYWIVERLPDNAFRLHVWKQKHRRMSWREITFAGGPTRWGKGDGCAHTYSGTLDGQFGSIEPLT
jgi:hypothetical protein